MKEISRLIIERAITHAKVEIGWFEMLKERLISTYEKHGTVYPFYTALIGQEDDNEIVSIVDNTMINLTPVEFKKLVSYNFKHGAPLICCSFSCSLEMKTHTGQMRRGALITFETPLIAKKMIYLEHRINGKIKLIADQFESTYGVLPKELLMFTRLIQTGVEGLSSTAN